MRNIIEIPCDSVKVLRMDNHSYVSGFLLEEQYSLNSSLSGQVVDQNVQDAILGQNAYLFQAPNEVFRKLSKDDQLKIDQNNPDIFKNMKFRSGYECFYASISKTLLSFNDAQKVFDEYFLSFATQPYVIYETKYETLLIIWLFLGDDIKTYQSIYGDILQMAKSRGELEFNILENGDVEVKHKVFQKMSSLNWQEGFVFDNEDYDSVSGCFCYTQKPMNHEGFELPVMRMQYTHNNVYDSLMLDFQKENIEEIRRIQDQYYKTKIISYQKLLNFETYEDALEEWQYFTENKCIPNGLVLSCIDGSELTLNDILKSPDRYNGKMFIDPLNGLPEKYNAILDLSNPSEPSLIIEAGFKDKFVIHFGLNEETFILLLSMFKHEYFRKEDNSSYYNQLGRIGKLNEKELRTITNYYASNGLNIKGFNQYYLFKDYDLDPKGKVLPIVDNFEKYIQVNKYDLFFDPIKKVPVLMGGTKQKNNATDVYSNFRKGLTNLGLNPDKMIKSYYDDYANEHPKNYLWEMIYGFSQNITEEDVKEFDAFISCFELSKLMDKELFMQVMNILLLQLVATIDGAEHSPIVNKSGTFEYMFVFVGEGGIGKSKVFSTMFEMIGAKNYFNGEGNPDFSDKARNLNFFNYAITEISECEEITLNTKLLENTKRIISRSEDEIYDKKTKSLRMYKRYTMFIGTTNERYFVLEENLRRFATIPVTQITDVRFDVDYRKLLGYYVKKYLNGAKWWLSRQDAEDMQLLEKMDIVTLNHHAEGEVKIMAKEVFTRTAKSESNYYMSSGEIWVALKGNKANETQVKRLAKALRLEGVSQSDTTTKFHVANSLYNDYIAKMNQMM